MYKNLLLKIQTECANMSFYLSMTLKVNDNTLILHSSKESNQPMFHGNKGFNY